MQASERVHNVERIAELEAEVEKLKTQIKLNVDYATQCATVEKERDELRQGIKKYLGQFPEHDQGSLELWQLVNGGAIDE